MHFVADAHGINSMLISILQFIVAVIVIGLILLQERSSGVGAMWGGGDGEFYQRRRGLERLIFFATIGVVILFAVLALLALHR